MSFSGTPERSAIAVPSPVHAYAFVVTRYWRPAPPVASTVVLPPTVFKPPLTRSQQITPWQRPSLTTSCHAKNSSYTLMSRLHTCSYSTWMSTWPVMSAA